MNNQLVQAVNGRDGALLSRMANGSTDQQKVINPEAEGLVDSLFRQLKQIFPCVYADKPEN